MKKITKPITMLVISILISGCGATTAAVFSGLGTAYDGIREYISIQEDCEKDEKDDSWYCVDRSGDRGVDVGDDPKGEKGGSIQGDVAGVEN